jgi:hypothetical protein
VTSEDISTHLLPDTVGATIAVCGMVERILSTLLDDDNDRKREKIAAIVSLAQCREHTRPILF